MFGKVATMKDVEKKLDDISNEMDISWRRLKRTFLIVLI